MQPMLFARSWSHRSRVALVALCLCAACSQKKCGPPPAPVPQASPTQEVRAKRPTSAVEVARPAPALTKLPPGSKATPPWGKGAHARGTRGVVTSVEDAATRAGVSILERGGNAVDAAIATALALAVTHPSAGNLGGGGFMVLRLGPIVEAIDFREDSPRALTNERFWKMISGGGRGPASVGVPGTVAGLFLAHQRHGKLPWKDLVSPALDLAENGYELGARQAKTIAWAHQDLLRDPSAREELLPGGKVPKVGARITRPRLALALRRIRDEGPAGFYDGPTASDIVESLGKEGLLTREDLEHYAAKVREPLYFDFENYRIVTMPAPSAGGVALTQSLVMLDALEIENTAPDSSKRWHLLAEVARRAQVERQLFVTAPERLSAEEAQAMRSRALDPQTWLGPHPVHPTRATESKTLDPRFPAVERELAHTTHLSVVDGSSGLVSLTVTLSGSFGSRVFSKETGIVLNNSAASFTSVGPNTPVPGQRTTSSMAPTLVLGGDRLALVLGSPGGNTIPSTVMQTIAALVLDEVSLADALDRPRIHQTFAPGELLMESTRPLSPKVQKELRTMGHTVSSARSAIGDANIAARIDKETFAVADPREGGLALAASDESPVPAPQSEP